MDELERGEILMQAVSQMHRLQIEKLGKLEISLTLRQFRILQQVSEGYSSLSDLSRLSRRSLPTTSESVDGLLRRKLLTRKPSEADRRAVVLNLTPLGEKALALGSDCLNQLAEALFAELPASRQKVLEQLVRRMYSYAGERMTDIDVTDYPT